MAKTVDYGIDLGTTNSAIARMTPKGPQIIPVKALQFIPSVVATDKRGDLKVGLEALSPHFDYQRWFKRNMGTQTSVRMGDRDWTPEQLSAEVLKALKAAVKLKTNEDLEDIVITVPAMFSQPQCAATQAAAVQAGLNAVVLLQEPIAAATAYLSEAPLDGSYLVFDLGGGTFDASVIRLRDGEMNVVGHGGDNYLGGADFDRAMFDWVLDQIDRKGGDTSQFESGAPRRQLFGFCEEARVALSDQDHYTIYLDDFDLPIAKLDFPRERLEDMVEDLVTRTIQLAQDRLESASLSPKDIASILLVGGPTQMPYVRRRLSDELNIPINLDQDPMTVVAKGAAIHASTLLKQQTETSSTSPSEAKLELYYEPVSPDEVTTVAGKVAHPANFAGEIQVIAARGDWATGWKLLVNSAFSAEVPLLNQQISEFSIALRDQQGKAISVNPSSFSIRSGVRSAQPVTPYNFSVVLEGGVKVKKIVEAGQPLPATGSYGDFKVAKTLVAGSPDELSIYFVEGFSPLADENFKVGMLTIRGTDIKRTLRENERVEIRIRVDESRTVKAKVYLPSLDEDFTVEMQYALDAPDETDLKAAVRETKVAMLEIEEHLEESEQDVVLKTGRQIEQLEASLDRVHKGEIGEAERVHKQLMEAKAILRPFRDKYALKARHAQVISLIEESAVLCKEFKDSLGLAKLQDLEEDANKALRLDQHDTLDAVLERVRDIFWDHYGKTAACWEYQVELMHLRAESASDPLTYHELVRKAEAALQDQDYEGVRLYYLQSCKMLPSSEKQMGRFHDAAIRY